MICILLALVILLFATPAWGGKVIHMIPQAPQVATIPPESKPMPEETARRNIFWRRRSVHRIYPWVLWRRPRWLIFHWAVFNNPASYLLAISGITVIALE